VVQAAPPVGLEEVATVWLLERASHTFPFQAIACQLPEGGVPAGAHAAPLAVYAISPFAEKAELVEATATANVPLLAQIHPGRAEVGIVAEHWAQVTPPFWV